MSKEKELFWRTVGFTSAIILSVIILLVGIGESYRQIRRIGFDEYKSAVEQTDGTLRILDFTF